MSRFSFIRTLAVLTLSLLPIGALAAVNIQKVTSPGGITAWLVEEHSIPFTALEIRFKGGASLDAPGKRGEINLMTALLEEGAGDMDSRAFSAARDSLAASLNFDVHSDALSVSARVLSENRDQAMDLLRLALTDPRFDPDALKRVRGQVLSNIRSNAKDPNKIASRRFNHMAFGDHPYGSPYSGTIESVRALTRQDMFAAKARVMARDRVYVGVVGDITPAQLGPLLDRLLGDLPAKGAPMPPQAKVLLTGGLTVVPFDTPQSVAVFGEKGIALDDPDFFSAYVLNQILGGSGFDSRLMTEVREKRGLTYGVSTYLASRAFGALLMGQVASANDKIAKAIEVIREQWRKLALDGVSDEELARAKTYLTGAYPLRFDGNGPIANILVGMQLQGMPIDYIATRNDHINAVTQADIRRVIARLIRPDDLRFVVVGQPVGLSPEN